MFAAGSARARASIGAMITRHGNGGLHMAGTHTRLLEEWKANLDLLKFYETLKQQRFAHFLTIQTAFLALFGLVAKDAAGVFSLVTIATLAVVPIPPLFISFYFMRLDRRGRAFIDTANTRLLLIESEWQQRFPDDHFATYQQQFGVLARRDETLIAQYVSTRNVAKDPYPMLVNAPSAHASETAIIRLFWWLWVILFSGFALHLAWHLANPDWRPG
jgi:hypothetical protein